MTLDSDVTPTRLEFGTPVVCGDATVGTVLRVLIDQAAGTVSHLAIGPHHGDGRLVPIAELTSADGGLALTCTRAEFDAFPPDQDQELLRNAADAFAATTPPHSAAAIGFLSVFNELTPTAIARPLPGAYPAPEVESFDRVPAGEEQLQLDEQVQAQDGPIGRLSGVTVDLNTRRVLQLLIETGHLWAKRHIAIPFDAVEHIGISVKLARSRQQIRELEMS